MVEEESLEPSQLDSHKLSWPCQEVTDEDEQVLLESDPQAEEEEVAGQVEEEVC